MDAKDECPRTHRSAKAKATYRPVSQLINAWGRGTEGKLASGVGAKVDTDNDPTGAPKCKRVVTPLNLAIYRFVQRAVSPPRATAAAHLPLLGSNTGWHNRGFGTRTLLPRPQSADHRHSLRQSFSCTPTSQATCCKLQSELLDFATISTCLSTLFVDNQGLHTFFVLNNK